jgi:hypothetical protein
MSSYGLPYMGSKSIIVKNLCKVFPKADHFYDLFGGGFSVTHGMLTHRAKGYKHFHFNEIRPGVCELIKDCIDGKYSYQNFKPEFITRERYFKEKEDNPYIKLCWSFGNNCEDYLFSKEIEPYKRSMHNAVVFNKFDNLAKEVIGLNAFPIESKINSRRLMIRSKIEFYRKKGIPKVLHKYLSHKQLEQLERLEQLQELQQLQQLQHLERLQQLQQLQRLERLQQLQQLQQLQRLERLNFYNKSYEQVSIMENSVVYCDIPYKGTVEYDKNKNFNRKKFLNWAHELKHPVYISEYNVNDKRFRQIKAINKRVLMASSGKAPDKLEKIYVNQFCYEKFYEK